jgi:hypothetical protein
MSSIFKSIQPSQIRLNPFKVYKEWSGNSASLYTQYEGKLVADLTRLGPPYAESTDTTANGKLKGSVYQSIYHLFYRNYYTNTAATFGSNSNLNQNRSIYDFTTVLSLSQNKVGEGILPGSVKLQYSKLLSGSAAGSGYFAKSPVIVDDGDGNLTYSTNIDSTGSLTTFYDVDGNQLGLPSMYSASAVTRFRQIQNNELIYNLEISRFVPFYGESTNTGSFAFWLNGWPLTTKFTNTIPVTSSRGLDLQFSNTKTSSLELNIQDNTINDRYNFVDSDYSIGFCINVTGDADYSGVILEKKADDVIYEATVAGQNLTQQVKKYPYSLGLDYTLSTNKWNLSFNKTDGINNTNCVVSNLSGSSTYHVWLTRSGSNYILAATKINEYPITTTPNDIINSASVVDAIDDKYTANKSSIWIGRNAEGISGSNFNFGGLSIYNASYGIQSPEHVFQIFSGGKNTLNVGNVFYSHGLISLTDPVTYQRLTPYSTVYPTNLQYRSTVTIRETEVSCTINPGEYQFTSNPTAQVYDPITKQYKLAGFATASTFTPYVTQVGLYDDVGNLLVVGKLNKAIRPPGNVDTTFLVKYDR